MRENKLVRICPVCHKAFTNKEGQTNVNSTCSVACGLLFARCDKYARAHMIDQAEECKREPRTDCRMYMKSGSCSGLNALWCRFEDCKFYKPLEDHNG